MTLPTPDRATSPRWGFGDVGIALGGSVVFAVLVALLARPAVQAGFVSKSWALIALLAVPWVALAGWPVLTSIIKGNGPRIDFGLRLGWRELWIGVLGGVAALIVATVVAAITVAIHGPFDSAAGEVAKEIVDRPALVIFALCAAFGAPIAEELAFRGLTFGVFKKIGFTPVWSVVWSAVMFAAFHLEPIRFPLLLGVGLVFGAVRAYTGSTAAAMVSHCVLNVPAALTLLVVTQHP